MDKANHISGYYCFRCDCFTAAKRESRKMGTCPKCGHRMDYLRGVNLDSRNWYAGDYEAVIDEDGVKEEYVCFTGSGDYTPEDLEEFIDEIFTSISSNCCEVDMRAVRAANRAARM